MKRLIIAIIVFSSLLQSCTTTRGSHSYLISSPYDSGLNQTNYTIIPGGTIVLPGKCKAGEFVESSRQQFFESDRGLYFSVTMAPKDKYEFYMDSLSDFQFAYSFYEWESNYFNENEIRVNDTLVDHSTSLIETNPNNGTVIWSLNLPEHNTVYFQYSKGPWFVMFLSTVKKSDFEETIAFFREVYSLNHNSNFTPEDSHK